MNIYGWVGGRVGEAVTASDSGEGIVDSHVVLNNAS